ncbi:MAG TPA: Rid family detoxifying hydrolase [Candidatus Bathyarchaeia archaeon]
MKKVLLTQNAPKPIGPYNQAVQAGSFLFISGQLAIDPQKGTLIVENIKMQTRQVMENIKAILEAADYHLKDVVQSTVYLSSLSLFEELNQEYAKHFEVDFPARVTVGAELKSGALVEVSVVAYKD